MTRPGAAGLLAVLLVASAALPVGTALAGAQAGHPSVSGPGGPAASTSQGDAGSLATQQTFDQTEFQIHLFENGSARWTFRYMKNLNDSNRAEFQDYADEFNSNETQLYTDFQNRSRDLAGQGENVTGRDMDATGFSKEARVDQVSGQRGIVEMSFMWTNFSATPGDRVLVGDVFEGGLYLGPNQALTFSHGSELQFYEVQPEPSSYSDAEGRLGASESITYRGEREFNRSRPAIELGPPRDGGNGTDTSESPGGPPDDGFGPLALVALFVALLLGLGAVYAYRSGALGGDSSGGTSGSNPGGSGSSGGSAASPPPEPAISDEELLSDEDRVLKLLEDRGGRMKQVKIVEDTGWSKSKVSMLLSDMEDAGDISKLRVGRENIVSLSGHEPDAARSPFEDEE